MLLNKHNAHVPLKNTVAADIKYLQLLETKTINIVYFAQLLLKILGSRSIAQFAFLLPL